MKFSVARKLHNEDEITIKKTGQILRVVEVQVEEKACFILCDDGNQYHHMEVS